MSKHSYRAEITEIKNKSTVNTLTEWRLKKKSYWQPWLVLFAITSREVCTLTNEEAEEAVHLVFIKTG